MHFRTWHVALFMMSNVLNNAYLVLCSGGCLLYCEVFDLLRLISMFLYSGPILVGRRVSTGLKIMQQIDLSVTDELL